MIQTAVGKVAFFSKRLRLRIFIALYALSLFQSAPAQVTVTPTSIGDSGTFTVSNTDLLQTNLGTATITAGNGYYFFGTNSLATLTDGAFGAAGGDSTASVSFDAGVVGVVVRFTFDLTASPAGYDLTEIRTYTGWDSGRDGQEYSLAYSVVAAPTTFLALAAVGPYDVLGAPPAGRILVTITDALAGTIVGNVAALQFTFTSFENNSSAWREIDAIGTPTAIPEPSTYAAFVGVAALGLAMVRRRKVAT